MSSHNITKLYLKYSMVMWVIYEASTAAWCSASTKACVVSAIFFLNPSSVFRAPSNRFLAVAFSSLSDSGLVVIIVRVDE